MEATHTQGALALAPTKDGPPHALLASVRADPSHTQGALAPTMDGPPHALLASVRADPSLATSIPSHIMIAGATGEVGAYLI